MNHSPKPGGPQVENWPKLARIHGTDSSSKVRWATSQASAVCRLVSFQRDYSRADVSSSVVSCCLLGSRVLLGKGAGVLKGDLVWWGWVGDAFLFEGSWHHSAVGDPGNDLCFFNCMGMDKTTNLQWGFNGWTFHSFTQTASLVYKGAWELSG
jgi:hypothetical protein